MLLEQFRPVDPFPFKDNHRNTFGRTNVLKRVSIDNQ